MNQPWTIRQRPERLERRLEFNNYDTTRIFLEKLSRLSEIKGRYPDLSFGRTYVNLTLRPDTQEGLIGEADHQLAADIDALL